MQSPEQKIADLKARLEGRLQGFAAFDDATRSLYATAACMYKMMPLGVLFPKSTQDVSVAVNACARLKIPVTARGAGSSLVGQAVNSGLIIDFSRFMTQILGYDRSTETVTLEPGVIYADLNRYLSEFDRYFPPDPSSGNYCTVGGMVANNAAGAHSLTNGPTIDYVHSLQVVLADGQIIETRPWPMGSAELAEHLVGAEQNFESELYQLCNEQKALIQKYTPRVPKIASGYRLEEVIRNGVYNPSKIFCGSEGTLGIVTGITVSVKRPPIYKQLVVINFDLLKDAARAIAFILETNPAAVEMIEEKAMQFVRRYRQDLHDFYPPGIASQLFVEYADLEESRVHLGVQRLNSVLAAQFKNGVSWRVCSDAEEQAQLWNIRKASFPLVYLEKRPEKVPAFIEDFVVPPKAIAEFIAFLYRVYEKYDSETMILGHAGSGNFHTRPFINFADPADLDKMQAMLAEISARVLQLGGATSGEHGDGRARAHLLPQQAGPLYAVYEQVKQLFDSREIMNPGVKINRENQLTKNLRFDPQYRRQTTETILHFDTDDYYYEIEKCHGCSACHQPNHQTTMCPVFQITGDELAAPRGKANILQGLISGTLPAEFETSASYKQMLDFCVYCEGCFVECPSHVDVGRLLLEHKARYRQQFGAGKTQWLLEHSETLSKIQAWAAPLVNVANRVPIMRALMEKATGIDRRRPLPDVRFPWQFYRMNRTKAPERPLDKVFLFHDLYARYNQPELTGLAIKILQHFGIVVESKPVAASAMPAIVYGNTEFARKTIKKSVPHLTQFINQGYKIVSTEPTAALALRKEWHDLVPETDVQLISKNTFEFFDYLRTFLNEQKIKPDYAEIAVHYAYHAPCHLTAMRVGLPGVEILRSIPGVQVDIIDKGCCGIAGTYGFKQGANGYEQSMEIGAELFRALDEPQVEFGLSECSTCRMQMEHGSSRKIFHPIQVLARALNIN